ncbi:AraC family transcriptional regulator [Actinocatenispora thailandica]|uniref:AraC family transcriptional regulator n=1 Tax=Actinocatenispora thailandica TaxID=227318 RepID=A0A7R7DQF3_9ACTN|nr:helix-turn-helix transcriptional regulator [Actinocatenispora thailandica]BCJ35938.1 AraC family transcriptional regulator [Actinocatenispora thailandica]
MSAPDPAPAAPATAGGSTAATESGYRQWRAAVPGATLWTRRVGPAGSTGRILPDGCLDLIAVDGELLVAGPDTRAQWSTSPPGARFAAVRFDPGVGPAVLGVPGYELRDARVPLAALWPAHRVRALAGRIAGSADPAAALAAALAEPLHAANDPALRALVAELRRGTPVGAVAAESYLSERQLHRRCRDAFGYGPKTLARILRMNRALDAARTGRSLVQVAAAFGYADQAHLTRDVRALTGVPPSTLLTG